MIRTTIAMAGLGALAALTACAETPEQKSARVADNERELAAELEGRVAGTPVDCINPSTFGSAGARAVGGAILYRDGSRVWRSDPPGGCSTTSGDPIVIVEVRGGQICRNDRYSLLPRGANIPGPFCRFGPFVPYVKP